MQSLPLWGRCEVTEFHPTWQLRLTATEGAVQLIRARSAGARALGLR